MEKKHLFKLGACVAALSALALASGAALAQKTDLTKYSGTASGAGTVSRTIQDVPGGGPGGPALQVQDITVSFPVSNGQSPTTIGTNFINAVNTHPTLPGLGYSAVPSTPNGIADFSRPKMVKQTGSYNIVSDANTAPGVTFAPSARTVLDAPALSPAGLGFLVGALPALAFWRRRRKVA